MNRLALALSSAAMILTAQPALAAVAFSDSFDGYGGTQLGWGGSGSWTTSSVDLVQSGNYNLTCAGGAGSCVDLSGSAPGSISRVIALAPGSYTLSFDYTGNQLDQYGGPWPQSGFTASIGGSSFAIGPLSNSSNVFTTFTSSAFTVTGPVTLSFVQATGGDRFRGSIIDNVSISTAGAVPEPGTWMMMIAGFGLVGAALRRRSRQAVLPLAAA